MNEFLHMGGYAAYIWSAYGIAAAVLIYNLIAPMSENKKIRKRIEHMLKEEQD